MFYGFRKKSCAKIIFSHSLVRWPTAPLKRNIFKNISFDYRSCGAIVKNNFNSYFPIYFYFFWHKLYKYYVVISKTYYTTCDIVLHSGRTLRFYKWFEIIDRYPQWFFCKKCKSCFVFLKIHTYMESINLFSYLSFLSILEFVHRVLYRQ